METKLLPVPTKRQIILMISQSCNLNCKYCYQPHKSQGLMTVETAKNIIENELFEIQKNGHTNEISFEYMGGEPLLNFKLIREISEWLWSKDISIPYELIVSSNGTLLSDEMKQWFASNKSRISFGLSMDGLSSMNKFNRTNQFIDWKFVKDNWPQNRINITLFKDSVNLLAETIREMNAAKIPFAVSIGDGFEWTQEAANILEEQLSNLIPDYINQKQEAVDCGLFSFRIADYFPEYPMYDIAVCGKSNNIIAYDTDGSPCICHVFSELVLGQKKARQTWHDCNNI